MKAAIVEIQIFISFISFYYIIFFGICQHHFCTTLKIVNETEIEVDFQNII